MIIVKHHKEWILLTLLVFLAFGQTLFHGFVGDDEFVIKENHFYESINNLPRLFKNSYLTVSNDVFFNPDSIDSSGSVAYRPVLSLTYFIDHLIWKKNPFGYHLTNILLHLSNTLFLFSLILFLIGNSNIAFWGACLFAIHPVQAEAVANIGYRADLVSTFFFLLTVYYYAYFRQKGGNLISAGRIVILTGLAYFSKESAIVLLPVLLTYEFCFKSKNLKIHISPIILWILLIFVTCGYLYTYFRIFPNTTLQHLSLTENLAFKIMLTLWTCTLYLKDIVYPMGIHPFPPFYNFNFSNNLISELIIAISVTVLFIYAIYKIYLKNPKGAFFGLWTLFALGPISQILPNPTPVAHRYIYLPMATMAPFLVIICAEIYHSFKINLSSSYQKIISFFIICLLLIFSIFTSSLWQHNLTISQSWITHYPKSSPSYVRAGLAHKIMGCSSSMPYFKKAYEMGNLNPHLNIELALCSNNLKIKETYLKEALRLYPIHGMAHYLLGKSYFDQELYEESLNPLLNSLDHNGPITGIVYAMEAFRKLGKEKQALQILSAAKRTLSAEQWSQLQNILPVDDRDKNHKKINQLNHKKSEKSIVPFE